MEAQGRGHKGSQVDELGRATDEDRTQGKPYRRFPCHRQLLDTMVRESENWGCKTVKMAGPSPHACESMFGGSRLFGRRFAASTYCVSYHFFRPQPCRTPIYPPDFPPLTSSKPLFNHPKSGKSAVLFLWRRFRHFFTLF